MSVSSLLYTVMLVNLCVADLLSRKCFGMASAGCVLVQPYAVCQESTLWSQL